MSNTGSPTMHHTSDQVQSHLCTFTCTYIPVWSHHNMYKLWKKEGEFFSNKRSRVFKQNGVKHFNHEGLLQKTFVVERPSWLKCLTPFCLKTLLHISQKNPPPFFFRMYNIANSLYSIINIIMELTDPPGGWINVLQLWPWIQLHCVKHTQFHLWSGHVWIMYMYMHHSSGAKKALAFVWVHTCMYMYQCHPLCTCMCLLTKQELMNVSTCTCTYMVACKKSYKLITNLRKGLTDLCEGLIHVDPGPFATWMSRPS